MPENRDPPQPQELPSSLKVFCSHHCVVSSPAKYKWQSL